MKIRIANKIMKNVRLYPCMHRVYGLPRVQKANELCVRHISKYDDVFNQWRILSNKDPLSALKLMLNGKEER